ncbi:aspartic peptidase domain-containing protein [Naematelia encephala]|uniref:Aspartic peptidase domain-containing protein n=1 Tax=Naematelia encephala TaxID=71784 RepID=A0A1Y2BBT0_9TREE|nr:aspartic peptidase domain-containing protein [Naematelia encephala]
MGQQCPFLSNSSPTPSETMPASRRRRRLQDGRDARALRRQASETSSSTPAYSYTTSSAVPSSTSSDSAYYEPYSSYEPSSSSAPSNTTYWHNTPYNATATSQTYTSTAYSTLSSSRTSATTSPFTAPWTYKASKTSSSHAAAKTTYVPGVVLNLTLSGNSDTEAVYAVPLQFGHNSTSLDEDAVFPRAKRAKSEPRASSSSVVQTMMLQVDLGSSDLWVASNSCGTSDCTSAPSLFDPSQSLDSGVAANMTYQSGSISGEIYWEEVQLGSFGIGYQAFISAENVANEGLGTGAFSGVLGLSLPADSVIVGLIPGTTSSNPDGATFLDNLFGSGLSAPTNRLFSLALERREDVRTTSLLGIGAISDKWCPSPCNPPYSPIVAQPSLGLTGYLYWRIAIQGVSATTWADEQSGTGPTTQNVTLGPSLVDTSKTTPLAVLDSGGVQILMGSRSYANSIYSAFGISQSSDGYYRMPCTKQISLAFTIAGQQFPVHPLDMTYPDPTDASQSTCIGMIQYSSTLGDTGDIILGSAFLKNVYSIFQYPDTSKQKTWQPTVGLVSLTNASIASQDFYAVRTLHESLSSVSSNTPMSGTTTSSGGGSTSQQSAQAAAGRKAVSSAVIAGSSVVGFFVLAAALFCAWWFWLRRKFGASGVVAYRERRQRPGSATHKSDISMSTLRSRKHEEAHRQKSMIEGLSDHEADSWMSTTEGNDSIRLGYMPEVVEEDEGRLSRGVNVDRHSRGSSLGNSSLGALDEDEPNSNPNVTRDPSPTRTRRELSPSRSRTRSIAFVSAESESDLHVPTPQPYVYPPSAPPPPKSARSMSLSMSGPFPNPVRSSNSNGVVRPDVSPMYDIRSSDYVAVQPRGRERASTAARERENRSDQVED